MARDNDLLILNEQLTQQAIQVSNKAVAVTGSGTVGAGMWTFLGENAQAIGAAAALVGVVLTAIAVAVNWWYRHKASKQ